MAEPAIEGILDTKSFAQAVVNINHRAERQQDIGKLIDIFVETDLPIRCNTIAHQLILGRRGTGKTHLIKHFQYFTQAAGDVVHYCDCTSLGSGFANAGSNSLSIASKYFTAFLNDLGTLLLDKAIQLEMPPDGLQDKIIGKLATGLVSFMDPATAEGHSVYNYRQISSTIKSVLDDLKIGRLYIIFDEWAQVPKDSQPFLAELIKRAILPIQSISIKLLAVNYQCIFSDSSSGQLIGLQRGADLTDIIDIDSYLVYDEKEEYVVNFFAQLLYNHLGAELKWDLKLSNQDKIRTVKKLFTQSDAFSELVRSAEGNCRDYICIFSRAYLEGYRQSSTSKSISIPNICKASALWYSSEKEANIKTEPDVQKILSYLLDNVLKGYKSRSFMVEMNKSEHSRLLRLLNERVLHRLNDTYSHPDRPGIRYQIFTLDHGAYIRFKGTVNETRDKIFYSAEDMAALSNDEKDTIVPIDDKRSIRRIVYDPDDMKLI